MRIDVYVHSDRDNTYEAGKKAGLTGKVLNLFEFAGYEHKMTYEVDEATGHATLVAVDGRYFK